VCSVVLDHFGWLGFEAHAASPLRLVGAALMIVGFVLISRF
jgi:transporter family-2 protein